MLISHFFTLHISSCVFFFFFNTKFEIGLIKELFKNDNPLPFFSLSLLT